MRIAFGNILDLPNSNPWVNHVIVHGCNAQGIMGSGLALQVRTRYPEAYRCYNTAIKNWNVEIDGPLLGSIIWYEVKPSLHIANAITQEHFGREKKRYVSYEAIDSVFAVIAHEAHKREMHVHFPMIGAGLGGGDWAVISDIIRFRLSGYDSVPYTLWLFEENHK